MPVRRSIFLVAAFAALLVICGGAAWAVWQNTRIAQANATLIHERDMAIHEALAQVRSDLYLTAILARDALLEDFAAPSDYKKQLDELKKQTDTALQVLRERIAGPELEDAMNQLKAELTAYDDATLALLAWTPQQRLVERQNALRLRVGRRRDILTLAKRIETLAVKSSADQKALIAAGDRYFRASLGWIAGVALLLGAGVAGFTYFRMRMLEEQSEMAQTELRSLSGQLRTAQEDERKYLSRELHDQVGQMLTGLRMDLAAISRSKAASTPELIAVLDRAKGNVEQTLSVVRNIAMLLRPSMLDDLGLTPALTWLAKETERSSGMEIHRDIDPVVDHLPDAHRTCLYRLVQEALTNASRHSGARSVDLRVTCIGASVQARVTDDGRGFDPALEKRKGLGLLGMEERVRELGGQLSIVSLPGKGATVEIVLPVPANFEGESTYVNDNRDNNRDDSGRSRHRPDRVKTAT
ncbi:MAG: histidine kinase [Bryobacteraceae bacterium]